jgi:hypothetical protein
LFAVQVRGGYVMFVTGLTGRWRAVSMAVRCCADQ